MVSTDQLVRAERREGANGARTMKPVWWSLVRKLMVKNGLPLVFSYTSAESASVVRPSSSAPVQCSTSFTILFTSASSSGCSESKGKTDEYVVAETSSARTQA